MGYLEGSSNKKIEELKKLKEENERLQEKLKTKTEQCQRYKKELVNNSVIERWKIGKYLHDGLGQQLTSAKILTSLLKNKLSKTESELTVLCDEIIDIIEESSNDVRNLSHDIIPMDVEKEGAFQAFNYLIKQAERQHGINCTLETGEIIKNIKHREIATNLYNIAQEAIKNAVIHGETENIEIALIEENGRLNLHIKDDGKGFEAEVEKKGRGITIMEHRAEEINGTFRISDAEDTHYTTCVSCSLPLEGITADE